MLKNVFILFLYLKSYYIFNVFFLSGPHIKAVQSSSTTRHLIKTSRSNTFSLWIFIYDIHFFFQKKLNDKEMKSHRIYA